MHATSETNQAVNLALFDFDGTLCTKDSFTSFIFYTLSKRHIVRQGMSQRPVTFFFRGKTQQVAGVAPVMTVLQFLREHGGLDQVRQTGTKEGCAEGDCGACTVVIGELVNDQLQLRSVNACIQFLPTLDGKALFTVEDLKTLTLSSESVLHPVQQAMVEHHGSQCGFCTPGFIMSLWSMYENESHAPDKAKVSDYLSGNLCRCTGYRPILDAAQKAFDYPKVMLERQNIIEALKQIQALPSLQLEYQGQQFFAPKTVQEFAALRQQYPQARIVAGSTDVGLWVTKLGRDLGDMLYIGMCLMCSPQAWCMQMMDKLLLKPFKAVRKIILKL